MTPGQLAEGCSGDQHEITGGCSNCPPVNDMPNEDELEDALLWAAQGFPGSTPTWPPPHGMREWGAGLGGPMSFLYGRVRQDFMHSTPEQVWQDWFVETGGLGQTIIEQWSTTDFDGIVPATRVIIDQILDDVADECGFVEAASVIDAAGKDPQVVAAFAAARSLLVAKAVGWRFADDLVAVGTMSTRWTSASRPGWTTSPFLRFGFDIPNMDIEWRIDRAT